MVQTTYPVIKKGICIYPIFAEFYDHKNIHVGNHFRFFTHTIKNIVRKCYFTKTVNLINMLVILIMKFKALFIVNVTQINSDHLHYQMNLAFK